MDFLMARFPHVAETRQILPFWEGPLQRVMQSLQGNKSTLHLQSVLGLCTVILSPRSSSSTPETLGQAYRKIHVSISPSLLLFKGEKIKIKKISSCLGQSILYCLGKGSTPGQGEGLQGAGWPCDTATAAPCS